MWVPGISLACLEAAAAQVGAQVLVEPDYRYAGVVTFADGRRQFFNLHYFNVNDAGAVGIANDKAYTAFFLRESGFSAPRNRVFFSDEACRRFRTDRDVEMGAAYARALGYPVIVKPNAASRGLLVAKVDSEEEFREAFARIVAMPEMAGQVLVEELCPGDDFRVVVIGDEVFAAYQRLPLTIVGDGRRSVAELVADTQDRLRAEGRHIAVDLRADPRIGEALAQLGLVLASVLERSQAVQLLFARNLSLGGSIREHTNDLHADYARLAKSAARAMGLGVCGVDILTADITAPLGQHTLLELNAAPGIKHYAALAGDAEGIITRYYRRILEWVRDRRRAG